MAHWGYGEKNGPATWGDDYPIARNPVHGQSPIDIDTAETTRPEGWRRLKLRFQPERCTRVHNNGHTVQVDVGPPGSDEEYNLRYGPLEDDFALAQFHFHWGQSDSEGSEHTLNGEPFAAEAHFVHYNKNKYANVNEAIDQYQGIAVLGVFLQVGRHNRALQKLLDHFGDIAYKGDHSDLPQGFNPKFLMPRRIHRQKYWHYYGSLTTPPLHESVNWFVFQKPVHISSEQLSAFRALYSHPRHGSPDRHDEFDGRIACNFRPPQPRNFTRRADGEEVVRPLYDFKRRCRPRPGQGGEVYDGDSGEDADSDGESSAESESGSEGEE